MASSTRAQGSLQPLGSSSLAAFWRHETPRPHCASLLLLLLLLLPLLAPLPPALALPSLFGRGGVSGTGSGTWSGAGSSSSTPGVPWVRLRELLREPSRLLRSIISALGASGSTHFYPVYPEELDPRKLKKFVDALPIPPTLNGKDPCTVLSIGAYKTLHSFHRDLPPATVYAYGTSKHTASYPGPSIEATRGVNTLIYWGNHIEDEEHLFAQDPTITRAQPVQGGVPTVVHRYGGEQAPDFNGHPSAWYTTRGDTGPGFKTNLYNYTNGQLPALLWYHDNTVGFSRLNVAAGLLGLYFIRDPTGLEKNLSLPAVEIPLVIADKALFKNGSILYPAKGDDPTRPIWQPFYRTTVSVVNGKLWPFLKVSRTAYRFRILGASNSRFFSLRFQALEPKGDPAKLPFKGPTIPFWQIGSSGGYLNRAVKLTSLVLAPGQRYDIIVDFAAVGVEYKDVVLVNDAPFPYPIGDAPDSHTGLLLKIKLEGKPFPPYPFPKLPPNAVAPMTINDKNTFRKVDLNVILNNETKQPLQFQVNARGYLGPPSERVFYGSTEAWDIINDTPYAESITLPLSFFVLSSRQKFNRALFDEYKCSIRNVTEPQCVYGKPSLPLPYETGWLDTVTALPGTITTLVPRWGPQTGGMFTFDPTPSPWYDWGSSLLEHKDNSLIRELLLFNRPAGETANWNETAQTWTGSGPVRTFP